MWKKGWIIIGFLVIIVAFIVSQMKGTKITEELLEEYDYIVVGSGSAGSVVAARLSEDPNVTVLLLEAGGDDSWNLKISTPALSALLQKSDVDWKFHTVPQKHSSYDFVENRSFWPRGKCLGGSSNLNTMAVTRGSRYDFDGWEELGCDGWSYKDVLPYFLKLEDIKIKELEKSDYHNKGGKIPITEEKITSILDVFTDAGKELGHAEVDYNGKDMLGVSNLQTSITANGLRASTSRMYLRPAMERPNLHISINSHVHRILFQNKKATAVKFTRNGVKRVTRVRREVVVSAGSVQSPQILMLSGIGPRKHLESLGINVISDLPVGESLQDHILVAISSHINKTDLLCPSNLLSVRTFWNYLVHGKGYLRHAGPLSGVAFFQLDDEMKKLKPGLPDIQFHLAPTLYQSDPKIVHSILNFSEEAHRRFLDSATKVEGRQGFVIGVNVAHPKSRGTIRLKSTDPFEPPLIDPRYFEHDDDVKLTIKGIREARRFMNTKAMRDLGANPDEPHLRHTKCETEHKYDSDEYWECVVRSTGLTVYHPTSTCKMGGNDDKTAVVDSKLRVKGVQGLRVVDASIMPVITTGNTNIPIIMIAEKASDMIKGTNSVQQLIDKVQTFL